jgi:hypothetical protein
VFYGVLGFYKNVLLYLEDQSLLNVEDALHLSVLHFVFLPRLNRHLREFMLAWNNHPLSTEAGYSPSQIFLMSLPPPDQDLSLDEVVTN